MTEKREIYHKGYKAFKEQVGVNNCPEKTVEKMKFWLSGWQDAFNDFMGSFD
jgi:ribosome modulation factor